VRPLSTRQLIFGWFVTAGLSAFGWHYIVPAANDGGNEPTHKALTVTTADAATKRRELKRLPVLVDQDEPGIAQPKVRSRWFQVDYLKARRFEKGKRDPDVIWHTHGGTGIFTPTLKGPDSPTAHITQETCRGDDDFECAIRNAFFKQARREAPFERSIQLNTLMKYLRMSPVYNNDELRKMQEEIAKASGRTDKGALQWEIQKEAVEKQRRIAGAANRVVTKLAREILDEKDIAALLLLHQRFTGFGYGWNDIPRKQIAEAVTRRATKLAQEAVSARDIETLVVMDRYLQGFGHGWNGLTHILSTMPITANQQSNFRKHAWDLHAVFYNPDSPRQDAEMVKILLGHIVTVTNRTPSQTVGTVKMPAAKDAPHNH
jgi:hypothetical protein